MASLREPRFDRRAGACASVLGLVLGLGGCFHDSFMGPDDDEPVTSTDAGEGAGSTGSTGVLPGTTATEPGDGTTGQVGSTSGVAADEGSGSGPGSGPGDEGGSSTGAMQDESTGGPTVLGVDELEPGDLVITEVMWNPSCSGDTCEWIEILNTTDSPVSLLDLYVQDDDRSVANQGRVTVDLVVEPGDVAVITRGTSSWPYAFAPDAIYGPNPGLNNGEPDRVIVLNAAGVLDQTALFFLDVEEGVAWSLSGDLLDATSNDDAVSWCGATATLPADWNTEHGSPGELNGSCAG